MPNRRSVRRINPIRRRAVTPDRGPTAATMPQLLDGPEAATARATRQPRCLSSRRRAGRNRQSNPAATMPQLLDGAQAATARATPQPRCLSSSTAPKPRPPSRKRSYTLAGSALRNLQPPINPVPARATSPVRPVRTSAYRGWLDGCGVRGSRSRRGRDKKIDRLSAWVQASRFGSHSRLHRSQRGAPP